MKNKCAAIDKLKKEACKVAKVYCGKEPVHGMPHINRMLKNFRLLRKKNLSIDKTGEEILDVVEFVIILHDIGKKFEKPEKKHGTIAIEILKEDYKNFFRKIPNYQWVEYAIDGHTNGIKIGKCEIPNTSQKICLVLLLALDNIDAIGEIGVRRDLKDMKDKFKWLPNPNNKEGESFLERLLKNYYHIDDNVSRIKKIKSKIKTKFLLEIYEKLKKEQEEYIFRLIREKKLRIKNSEINKVLVA